MTKSASSLPVRASWGGLIGGTLIYVWRLIEESLEGRTLNPAVGIVALCLSVGAIAYIIDRERDMSMDLSDPPQHVPLLQLYLSGSLYLCGVIISHWGYQLLSGSMSDPQGLQYRLYGVLIEGLGLWGLWFLFLNERYPKALSTQLSFPLAISLFSLPWEPFLRSFDVHLQALSADIAVFIIDLYDGCVSDRISVSYWDTYTFYSDAFYLIVNETCSGVNLLISMSLYAVGFSWVIGATPKRSLTLIAYLLPLCLLFNGVRVAAIFFMGHFGGEALAMGAWHEGSGYVCQLILFILLAQIHRSLNASST